MGHGYVSACPVPENEETLLVSARKAGFNTAAVGKIGPVFIQDITDQKGEATMIVDIAVAR